MTDREKLIELIDKARYGAAEMCHEQSCVGCSRWNDRPHCRNSFIADHLLANGVTFATDTNGDKWTPTAEKLPKDGEIVLVYAKEWGCIVAEWRRKWREWENWNSQEDHMLLFEEVSHWMPLPEPPKEEYR